MTRSAETRSVRQRRRRGLWLLAGSGVVLAGLLIAGIRFSRPDTNSDERFVRLWNPSTRQQMTEEERRALTAQWQQLDPESKRRISQIVFHQELDRFRQEFERKSLEEQKDWVASEVTKMQARFHNLSEPERAKMERQLNSDEGRTYLKNIFTSYHQDLSAHEQAVLEPLVRELVIQLETFQ